jgi:hypothetical protein
MAKKIANFFYKFIKRKKENFNGGTEMPDDMNSSDALLYFVLLIIFLMLLSYVFQLFWNNYLTSKLGAKEVSYFEAFVMYFMFHLLF